MSDDKIIDITHEVEARKKAEASVLNDAAPAKDDGITGSFVRDCLNANERGDGALFAAKQRGKVLYNKTSSQWLRWGGHHWDIDVMEEAYRLVEDIAIAYIDEAAAITPKIAQAKTDGKEELQKALEVIRQSFYGRASRLRSIRGAQNCLSWAHRVEDGLGVRGEEFDRNPWLLACRNGVIDLRTGRFRDGRPGDMITRAAPHEWTGIDTPCPSWEKFLDDVFAGDRELIAYVQRLFGYAATGIVDEHIFAVLHGEGRNGKGTLVEILRYVLGDVARPIQSELLLDQRASRSSSGPSPDIMGLKGLRIAFASETDEGRRFSSSKVKWLSGGDTLIGRNPHDKHETTFKPTHLLCLLTNHLPHAPGDEFSFWQRLHLIPFKIKFVDAPAADNERQKVKDLCARLEAEASGILAWLVRGCLEWRRGGLNPPMVVKSATEQYRMSEDLLAEFLEACCGLEDDSEARETFKDVYDAFTKWYTKSIGDEKYCPKKKKFSQLMEKRFKKEKAGGTIYFSGLTLKPDFER